MAKIRMAFEENARFKIITAAIALLTIVICYGLIRSGTRQADELRLKIVQESKNLVLRRDIDKIDKLVKEYRNFLYKPDKLALRDNISAIARQSGVDVLSMQPMAPQRIGNFTKTSLMVKLRSTYNQLGSFVANVEALEGLTRIEDMTIERSGGGYDYGTGRGVGYSDKKDILKEEKAETSVIISAYSSGH